MKDPLMDPFGHSYEAENIRKWVGQHGTSPLTKQPLTLDQLARNHALRNSIEEWIAIRQGGAAVPRAAGAAVSDAAAPATEAVAAPAPQPLSLQVGAKGRDAMISIKPPARDARSPVDICCVVDVSGSMGDAAKMRNADGAQESHGFSLLDIVKHSVRTIMACLLPGDRLSLVTFSSGGTTVFGLLNMDASGRKTADTAIGQMKPLENTNIWAGIEHGLAVFSEEPRNPNRIPAILLLTDGQPNAGPSIGALKSLENYKARREGRLPCALHTFGFGYNLESVLLRDLATVGEGLYGFIPDASFVGTAFVNVVSNMLVTTGTNVRLTIKGPIERVHGDYKEEGASTPTSRTLILGALHSDQDTTVVVTMADAAAAHSLLVELSYELVGVGQTVVSVTGPSDDQIDASELQFQSLRLQIVETIREGMNLMQFDSPKCQQLVAATSKDIGTCAIKDQPRVRALLTDVSGQVVEAVSEPGAYKKWGRHYLLALAHAHLYQQCTNFKDPGLQGYGGEYYKTLREQADQIFCSLPPPTRTCVNASARVLSAPAPASMRSYHNSSNPCFAGTSLMQMANGSRKLVAEVQKHDRVALPDGGVAEVVCVVKTACADAQAILCELGDGLLITPYHPVRVNGRWFFPCDLAPGTALPCPAVFSFVLSTGHVVTINGVECVTLGHSFTEDVVRHAYFGSPAIVADLSALPGWMAGLIEFAPGCMRRSAEGQQLLCGFKPECLITL